MAHLENSREDISQNQAHVVQEAVMAPSLLYDPVQVSHLPRALMFSSVKWA